MHTRQEWEEQEFDVCEGTTHVTLSCTVLVSIQCNEFVNTFYDRTLHTVICSDHYTVCSRRDSNSRKVACSAAHRMAALWLKMFL